MRQGGEPIPLPPFLESHWRSKLTTLNCCQQKHFAQRRRAAESTKKTRQLFISNLCVSGSPREFIYFFTASNRRDVCATVKEAIRCGTVHGAYASFEEKIKGSIEPGKLADLVVLGQDPFKTDPSSLVTIPVERTMVGGNWVYES
jgi:hypothetical protein